jgi:formylglycine-generating enzyme required for sulfatase activity
MPLLQPELGENDLLIEISRQAKAFLDGVLEIRFIIEHILGKQSGKERFLLVVDQWEELYTLAKKHADKDKPNPVKIFIDGLLDACEAGKLQVVLTLRGDFMGHVIGYRRLSDCLTDAQVNLSAMTQQELRQAIEQPALKLNTGFEPNLVDLLLTDVGEKSGNLPLMEFVLKRLWDDPLRTDKLRSQTYLTMGRLKGALQQEADALYDKLPSDQDRQQLRSLLLQLVVSNDANAYTRRRTDKDALDKQYGLLTQRLIDARLLVSNRDEKSGRNTLEVAHEALISDWPKLKNWLKEDIDFMAWRNRLNRAMDEQTLLKGQPLQDAKRWRKLKNKELNPHETQFIWQSQLKDWVALTMYSVLVLLPLLVVFEFDRWVEHHKLSRKVGVEVLLAKYLGYVHAPDMVTIPPSNDCTDAKPCEFIMGSTTGAPDEQPPHKVSFNKSFKMGIHEVTFDEYQVFAYLINQQGGCPNPVTGVNKLVAIVNEKIGTGQHPVTNLRWYEAQCYVDWLNVMLDTKSYHLPSEAQWEYAARAGTTGDYFWDEQKGEKWEEFAWFGHEETAAVGLLKANPFGLKDTAGNVMEWTADCYHRDYTQAENKQDNGKAWNEGDCRTPVIRGGDWLNDPAGLRSANRAWFFANYPDNFPDNNKDFIGFRLAQD